MRPQGRVRVPPVLRAAPTHGGWHSTLGARSRVACAPRLRSAPVYMQPTAPHARGGCMAASRSGAGGGGTCHALSGVRRTRVPAGSVATRRAVAASSAGSMWASHAHACFDADAILTCAGVCMRVAAPCR